MAAFTLKLVAKTKVQKNKNKTNMNMIPVSFNLSTEAKVMALPVYHSLVSSYLSATDQHSECDWTGILAQDPRLLPCFGKRTFGLRL